MLEMTKESCFNYIKALKKAMFGYAHGKDTERNGKKVISILKEFGVDISIDELTFLNDSVKYCEIDHIVDGLFFDNGGLFEKVSFF